MSFTYNALRGRIIEKYGTMANFAEILDMSKTSLSLKMTGKTGFSKKDIEKWCELLDIDFDDVGHYFFT